MVEAPVMVSPLRASNLQRAWLCPPSVWRETEIPEGDSSFAASEGSLLHAQVPLAYEYGDYGQLTDDQQWVVKSCVKLIERLVGKGEGCVFHFEKTIPVCDRQGNKIIEREVTPDLVIIFPNGLTIVIDWKTGRKEPQFDAGHDLQLLTYCVSVRNHYKGVDRIHAYRFHPRLWSEMRETSVAYEGTDADWLRRESTLKRIAKESRPEAKARAGATQCLYCKAKPVCKTFMEWSQPKDEDIPVPLPENLHPERLAEILSFKPRLDLLNKMMDEVVALTKKAVANGAEIVSPDGTRWVLKDGSKTREIKEVAAARFVLAPYMPVEAFTKACSLKVGELEKNFRLATGLKGKESKEKFNEVLGGLIEFKESSPALKQERVDDAAA